MPGGKGSGKQASTGTTTVTQEPAKFIAPYYTQAASESQNLYNTFRPEYFPGSTFVPFSPESEVSLQAQTARAMQGSPLTASAQDQALKTIRGDYLTGSPQLQQELANISGRVNSQFARGGGYRSSANQEILAREMADAALRNYQTERGFQQQAIGAAPALANQDYADIAALGQVGVAREDLFGRQLQDQMNYFNFMQQRDPQALDEYINRITQLGGGMASQTTTGTAPVLGRNPLSGALGGAQAGLGLQSALGAAGVATGGMGLPFAIGGGLLGALFG